MKPRAAIGALTTDELAAATRRIAGCAAKQGFGPAFGVLDGPHIASSRGAIGLCLFHAIL